MSDLEYKIHPLVPLAKASLLLRVPECDLLLMLTEGLIKGEERVLELLPFGGASGKKKKESQGPAEKSWFIWASEFDRLLNERLSTLEQRISTKGLEHIFEAKVSPEGELELPEMYSQAIVQEGPVPFETVHLGAGEGALTVAIIEEENVAAYFEDKVFTEAVGNALGKELMARFHAEVQKNEQLSLRLELLEKEVAGLKTELCLTMVPRLSLWQRVKAYLRYWVTASPQS